MGSDCSLKTCVVGCGFGFGAHIRVSLFKGQREGVGLRRGLHESRLGVACSTTPHYIYCEKLVLLGDWGWEAKGLRLIWHIVGRLGVSQELFCLDC